VVFGAGPRKRDMGGSVEEIANKKFRVLVIDDEEFARFSVCRILESEEVYEFVEAENGKIGVEKMNSGDFDLIITDIVMPEKEGLETIMEIRQSHPSIPIIAISGGGGGRNKEYLEVAKSFGAKCVLRKPFSADELLAAAEFCLADDASPT
jgi:CheY-like chemotaxis protein